jgi:hypothetical protein
MAPHAAPCSIHRLRGPFNPWYGQCPCSSHLGAVCLPCVVRLLPRRLPDTDWAWWDWPLLVAGASRRWPPRSRWATCCCMARSRPPCARSWPSSEQRLGRPARAAGHVQGARGLNLGPPARGLNHERPAPRGPWGRGARVEGGWARVEWQGWRGEGGGARVEGRGWRGERGGATACGEGGPPRHAARPHTRHQPPLILLRAHSLFRLSTSTRAQATRDAVDQHTAQLRAVPAQMWRQQRQQPSRRPMAKLCRGWVPRAMDGFQGKTCLD